MFYEERNQQNKKTKTKICLNQAGEHILLRDALHTLMNVGTMFNYIAQFFIKNI